MLPGLPESKRISLLSVWLIALAGGTAPAREAAERAPDPPNILLILVDDLGWMDLSVQGNPVVKTPHIDRLAAEGVRFTNAYAASPVCSPTRAAILTGLAPARLRITNHLPEREGFIPDDPVLLPAPTLDRLPREHVTFAERLREEAGYATGFLGKWHLSGPGDGLPAFEPTAQGFDLNVGGCSYGGPPTFFDPYRIPHLPSRKPGEYLPDRLADEALTFMKQAREGKQPFLLCLWPYAVHWPMEAPEAFLKRHAGHRGPGMNDERYGPMIEALDAALGRVLDGLETLGIQKETLVIFTSDNGGFSGVADNRPLRDGKGDLYEGGLRVPLILRWPGRIPAGAVDATPVISMDIHPTLLSSAGLSLPEPLDGENLIPVVSGKRDLSDRALCFHYPNYSWRRSNRLGGAIRRGPYKLIERFDDDSVELFHLDEDLSEQRDLAEERPGVATQLQAELSSWRDEVQAVMPRPVPRKQGE